MSDSVKILIEAENKSSAVIAQAAKDVDAKVKSIKASGEQAKKSTEFFGSIANTLGGTELGSYASQLAGLTEKTSQFAEVQKLGGAGALAFKAGLVGVAGVLGFQVGQGIGNVIFQTEKWQGELAKATTESDKLLASLRELNAFKFGRDTEEISLIRDPKERADATKAQLDKINNAIDDKKKTLEGLVAEKDKKENANAMSGLDFVTPAYGIRKAIARNSGGEDELKKQIAEGQLLIDDLVEQAKTIDRRTDATAKGIIAKKEENALRDKSDAFLGGLKEELTLLEAIRGEKINSSELQVKAKQGGAFGVEALSEAEKMLSAIKAIKEETAKQDKSDSFLAGLRDEVSLLRAKKDEIFAIEAGQKTFGAEAGVEAAQLLQEKEMLIAKRDAEKKAKDDELTKTKQIEDIRQRELDRLEEETVLLLKGKEAAHAFSLEKQGLSKMDAKKIAKEQSSIDILKDQEKLQAKDTPMLQAKESRLMTRGDDSSAEFQKITAQSAADTVKQLIELRKDMLESRRNSTTLKVISGGL